MIVAFLLKVTETSTHGDFCYVVNNPIDWTYCFNLPVLVVTFGQTKEAPRFQVVNGPPFTFNTSTPTTKTQSDEKLESEDQWKGCFRWKWRNDAGNFENYRDDANEILERNYSRYQCGNGPSAFETPPIIRYNDDQPQRYLIDFATNIQTNCNTGFKRSICRQKIDLQLPNCEWKFRNEYNQWEKYESLIQLTIEDAFKQYSDDLGPSSVVIRFPGRPETYTIDFILGKQFNDVSKTAREICRVPQIHH